MRRKFANEDVDFSDDSESDENDEIAIDEDDGQTIRITESMVKSMSDSQSYSRGYSYFRSGAVRKGVYWESGLQAIVEGSYNPHYQVKIDVFGKHIYGSCTCPVGISCKHCVAVCLEWIHNPEKFKPKSIKIHQNAMQPNFLINPNKSSLNLDDFNKIYKCTLKSDEGNQNFELLSELYVNDFNAVSSAQIVQDDLNRLFGAIWNNLVKENLSPSMFFTECQYPMQFWELNLSEIDDPSNLHEKNHSNQLFFLKTKSYLPFLSPIWIFSIIRAPTTQKDLLHK